MSTSPTHHAHDHPPGHEPAEAGHLAERRLGTASLVFLIIAASAPLTVLAGGVPTSFAVSGNLGVPLGMVLIGAVLAIFAVGYDAMSSRITNAGAFYAYIAAGLGVRQGIGAAVLALVAYNLIQISLYGLIGFTISSLLGAWFGIEVSWWLCALVILVVVGAMGVARVDFSAKIIAVLVALEFVVAGGAALLGLSVAPEGVSLAPVDPSALFGHGFGAVLAFGVAAFMGFESGAIYSEETTDPERTVPRATYLAVSIIALFYGFISWALAVGVGPSSVIAASQEFGPDLLFVFLGEHTSTFVVDIANLLFVTSVIAALVAFHNSAARYFFALARPGVLPAFLARTSPRTGAPIGGSLAQSAVALAVVAVFAVVGRGSDLGPLFPVVTLFAWFSNAAAFGLIFLLLITSVAVFAYFRREPQGVSVITRVVAPLVAAAGLTVIFAMILWNFPVLIGSEGMTPLVFIMPGVILAAGLAGLVRGEYLRRARPEVFEVVAHDLDQHT